MTRSSPLKTVTLGAFAALTLSTATQGVAQSGAITLPPEDPIELAQFLEDIGASERINLSGKLRMLSQRMPAAACNEHAGVAYGRQRMLTQKMSKEVCLITSDIYAEASLETLGGTMTVFWQRPATLIQ